MIASGSASSWHGHLPCGRQLFKGEPFFISSQCFKLLPCLEMLLVWVYYKTTGRTSSSKRGEFSEKFLTTLFRPLPFWKHILALSGDMLRFLHLFMVKHTYILPTYTFSYSLKAWVFNRYTCNNITSILQIKTMKKERKYISSFSVKKTVGKKKEKEEDTA